MCIFMIYESSQCVSRASNRNQSNEVLVEYGILKDVREQTKQTRECFSMLCLLSFAQYERNRSIVVTYLSKPIVILRCKSRSRTGKGSYPSSMFRAEDDRMSMIAIAGESSSKTLGSATVVSSHSSCAL